MRGPLRIDPPVANRSEAWLFKGFNVPSDVRSSRMPSRRERRKAERDAAKRASAQAGAAGAGGAAAARANVITNPVGDWTTQTAEPTVLFRAVGVEIVKQMAGAGDREAQFSLGYSLVRAADGAAGATSLGAAGRSPQSEHEQAVAWFTKGAEAGLPRAMYNLGTLLNTGEGVAAPDHRAAADWYRRAAEAGHAKAASNLSEPSESPDTRAIPPLDRTRAECSSQVCVAAVCTPPPAGYCHPFNFRVKPQNLSSLPINLLRQLD